MSQKTNQFNLRTIRYSISDIQKLSKKKNIYIKLVELSDLYGDHGIVGLIILRKINNSSIFIDTFLISCRVLSRKIEEYILKYVLTQCKAKIAYINFKKTEKNFELISKFLSNDFFTKLSNKQKKNIGFFKTNEIYKIENNKNLKNVKKFFKR